MNTDSPPTLVQRNRPWLTRAALGIFVLGLLLRLCYARELPANVAYELEAAYRMELGQCPYTDFYFDQFIPIVVWRMLTLVVGSVVAPCCGAPSVVTEWFLNVRVLGLASVLTTNTLCIFSFWLCFSLMDRFGKAVFAGHVKWLILLALAIANLAMGFEYGDQQHLFVLCFVPYLLTRFLVLQGADVVFRFKVLTAILAAVGASFNPIFLLAALTFELAEVVARRNIKVLFEITSAVFLLASAVILLNLLFLPKEASQALFGWILPIKYNNLNHDSFGFYGYGSTPECRNIFYLGVLALMFAAGGLSRFQLLRPLATMACLGLIISLTLIWGLSSDNLVLTYFTAMLLTVEGYFAVQWMTYRYSRFVFRKKEFACALLVLGGSLGAVYMLVRAEFKQRDLVHTAPARLRPITYQDLQDLTNAIKENSAPRSKVLIVNGKLRPAYPLLEQLGRQSCGYFMGSDVLGTLCDIRNLAHYDSAHGTAEPVVKAVEKRLYERLLADILRERPELICQEQGDLDAAFRLYNIQPILKARYDIMREGKYFTDHLGPREISEYNYNYTVYKLKPPAQTQAEKPPAQPAEKPPEKPPEKSPEKQADSQPEPLPPKQP